jgi:hypothetical protein
MSETKAAGTVKPFVPVNENRTFHDIVESLMGQVVTMVNPESYEDAPVGHQIRAGFYRAKLVGLGTDYFIVATELVHKGKETAKEPVRQYIPLAKIKRISVLKGEKLLHI